MTNVSSSGLSLGGIPKVALIAPWVASGASKVLIVRAGCQSGMPLGLPLVHLHPVLVIEPGGISAYIGKGQTKSNQERKALV